MDEYWMLSMAMALTTGETTSAMRSAPHVAMAEGSLEAVDGKARRPRLRLALPDGHTLTLALDRKRTRIVQEDQIVRPSQLTPRQHVTVQYFMEGGTATVRDLTVLRDGEARPRESDRSPLPSPAWGRQWAPDASRWDEVVESSAVAASAA